MDRSSDTRRALAAKPRGAAPSPDAGPSPETAAAMILETVPAAMRAIRTQMRAGRPVETSVPQFRALLYIRRQPGTDLSGVAGHLGTSAAAASELVARLVRLGLVVRTPHPDSRRRIRLELSPTGRDHIRDAEAGVRAWLLRLLETEDPASLGELEAGLEGLGRILGQERDGRAPGGPPAVRPGRAPGR